MTTKRVLSGASLVVVVVSWVVLARRDEPAPPAPPPTEVAAVESSKRQAPIALPLDGSCAGETPIIILEEEVEVTADVPKGGPDLSNLSNKNLDATSVVDAYGVGGGAAGAYGQRFGKGSLSSSGGMEGRNEGAPKVEPFTPAVGDGLMSTFAIDVDTASYSTVRQHLLRGSLPDPSSVRVEELINYFPYTDAPPAADAACPLAVRAEVASPPWSGPGRRRLVRVSLKAREVAARPPANLVFLIDVSGSMRAPGRLPLVKRALGLLVRQLSESDRVAIVVYAGASGLALPSTACDDPAPVLAALERLEAGGSTNGGAGLELAYRTAVDNFVPGGTNRVLLLSDGDWNVGTTGDDALEALITEKAKSGVFLSVLGFDMGRTTDAKMERLADKGNGAYAFIDGEREAKKVLVRELMGTLVTVAKDVKVQVEFAAARVASWRLVGYENRRLASSEFRQDAKDAGEVGAGHGVTALYEVVLKDGADAGEGPLAALRVRWKAPEAEVAQETEVPVDDLGQLLDEASADLRFATAVAAFGLLLRGDALPGLSLPGVRELAEGSLGDDPHGMRAELVDLVRRAEARRPTPPPPAPVSAPAPAPAAEEKQPVEPVETGCPLAPQGGAGGWLKRHQSTDGSWSPRGWADACGDAACASADVERADPRRDVGVTSLALLAFLGNGHTHRFGTYKQVVNRAQRWLRAAQREDGGFAAVADDDALATLALCELYAVSRDFTLKQPAQRAVDHVVAAQERDGSWALGETGAAGALRTARMTQALLAGRTAGLDVAQAAVERACAFLRGRLRPDDLRSETWRGAAGLAVFVRLVAGEARSTDDLREAIRVFTESVPSSTSPHAWHEGMLAAYQLGGAAFTAWNRAMLKALLPAQRTTGCAEGSWDAAVDSTGGRVEATALASLTLEVHYRYERAAN